MRSVFSLFAVLVSSPLYAADYHIADDVQLFMHSGPSYEYRIVSRVRSGDPVTLLERGKDYTKIKLADGKEGYVLTRYLAEGESKLTALQTELPDLKEQVALLSENLAKRNDQIAQLEIELASYRDEATDSTTELVIKDKRIRELEFQVANMDQSNLMRWLTHGGLIALAGLIVGLILPHLPRRKKRQDEWF